MSEQYQQQLAKQQEQVYLWSERAIKVRAEDEQKALQCVKRLRVAQQQVNLLEQQYQQSTAIAMPFIFILKNQIDKLFNFKQMYIL
jgi:phage shock protein A